MGERVRVRVNRKEARGIDQVNLGPERAYRELGNEFAFVDVSVSLSRGIHG